MMKKTLFLVMAIIGLVGCSKSDDGGSSGSGTYSIKVLKAEDITLRAIVAVYDGTTHTETVNKVLKEDFVKTYDVKQGNITVSVSGIGNDVSKLTLQLLKDGKVLKESTSSGPILGATVSN
ncbi:hypothetical protein [Capnocytophaga sp.]|uniref:hypothetical protein n=1 Tax=Capnocytophaga sp. TaxID=44737 RepID=UPI0026DD51EA|nr:hypothetical protein [Capnocytophaga sp.]MDO5106523.1 hypothetical protein [Capnocytophaga sp.]